MEKKAAAALLKREGYSLVLYNENEHKVFSSRGVAPLLSLLDSGEALCDFSAVDKVVGKAAAFLYIALGIRRVFALTVSESAYRLMCEQGVEVEYEALVSRILNRDGTGFCPMESAVLGESDPIYAIEKIRATLSKLRANAEK